MRVKSLRTRSFLLVFSFLTLITLLVSSVLLSQVNEQAELLLERHLYDSSLLLHSAYEDRLESLLTPAYVLAGSPDFLDAASRKDSASLRSSLLRLQEATHADIALVLDGSLALVSSARDGQPGERMTFNGLPERALFTGIPSLSTEILSSEELSVDRKDILLLTRIRRIPSPYSSDTSTPYLTEGLVQVVAIPLSGKGGSVGVLVLADILNRDSAFLHTLKQSTGLDSTLYLHDTTIATTITTERGNPYVGAVLPEAASLSTLEGGESFVGRVWGGKTWVRAAYLPLANHRSEVVGALSFSLPEDTFRKTQFLLKERDLTLVIIIVTLLALIISFFASAFISRKLIRPLAQLRRSIDVAVSGNLEQGVPPTAFTELNELINHYNQMIRSFRKKLDHDTSYGDPPERQEGWKRKEE